MPTMNQSCKIFPNGDFVPHTQSSSVSLIGGSTATLTVPYEITEADGSTYIFIYWNVDATLYPPQETNGTLDPEQTVTFPVRSDDSTFAATAWYVLVTPGVPGIGDVFAFSLNKDEELPNNSPIGTITPASAQTGTNTFSTTTSPDSVMVTAPRLIVPYGLFNQWLPWYESPNCTKVGQVLTVPAKGGIAAIAFYGIPVPDPCQSYRDTLQNTNCSELPPQERANCEHYLASVRATLHACEMQYGENPVP